MWLARNGEPHCSEYGDLSRRIVCNRDSAILNDWRHMRKYDAPYYGYDSDHENSWSSYTAPTYDRVLATQLWKAGNFVRGLGLQLRYGEISRAPLQLLRLQLIGDSVECEWMARPSDPWDVDLALSVQKSHASLQTIMDAISVRSLVFASFPHVDRALFRVYRDSPDSAREMIVTGYVQRNDNASRSVHSLVMRAKVLGFRFNLSDDTLHAISTEV